MKASLPKNHGRVRCSPNHAAYCGDIDLTGQRKPISHYREMLWKSLTPRSAEGRLQGKNPSPKGEGSIYMAVKEPDGYYGKIKATMWSVWPTYESWTWPGHEGKPIEVEVYSREPKVRLYLNDQLIGEKETSECKAVFTPPYQPGTLRAEVSTPRPTREGQGRGSASLQTAGEATAIRLSVSTPLHNREGKGVGLQADGQDLAFITVELTDADGTVNLTANNELTASVSGSATLIGFGNADIKDCDRYTDSTHKAWKGRALLVVRSTGKKGKATIMVQGTEQREPSELARRWPSRNGTRQSQGKGLKTARISLSFK